MKPWIFQALKMVIGALIATILSDWLTLEYSVTAGIIVILSIQPTKQQSIRVGVKRIIASVIGLMITVGLMLMFGYTLPVFILSLLLFIPLAFLFKIEEGIVVSAVLMSHILAKSDWKYGINALAILLIGVVIAVILNLFMPNKSKAIEKEILLIDEALRELVKSVAECECANYGPIMGMIENAIHTIRVESLNRLMPKRDLNISYVTMRKEQVSYIQKIEMDLKRVVVTEYKQDIVKFLQDIVPRIGKANMASLLLIQLDQMRASYKEKPLPKNRQEFEERAILFHILFDLEAFLMAKVRYHEIEQIS
jgi:uncharacterized membrane protein YgaE (UPF0421/DUF939 family)